MAGLVKAKKYDWKDSNLALFGSDTERKVKRMRDRYPSINHSTSSYLLSTGEERCC